VERNIAFGGRERVADLLDRFRITHLAAASVRQISGGERQRVALARALARGPEVLLLDEPLSALDSDTRARVRGELRALLHELRLPTLLVTHDFADAAALADRLIVLIDGRAHQSASAFELVARPADAFVASFTGASTLEATADGRRVLLDRGGELCSASVASGRVTVAIYPWDVELAAEGLPAKVTGLVPAGGRTRVLTDVVSADVAAGSALPKIGDVVRLRIAPEHVRLLEPRSKG
jgi:ABC-type sulfate/molybdate transport systems ATPase subunit